MSPGYGLISSLRVRDRPDLYLRQYMRELQTRQCLQPYCETSHIDTGGRWGAYGVPRWTLRKNCGRTNFHRMNTRRPLHRRMCQASQSNGSTLYVRCVRRCNQLMQTSVCQMRFWDQIQAVRPDLSELFKVLANSLEDKKAWEFVWPDDYALSDNGQNLIQMGIHNYLLRNRYPINRATTTSNAYGLNLALECGIPYLTFVRYVDEIYQMLSRSSTCAWRCGACCPRASTSSASRLWPAAR